LKKYEVGATVKCHVLGTIHRDTGGRRKSKGDSKQKKDVVQVELSLRKSHVNGVGAVVDSVIATIADVAPDSVHRGYVINTTDNGCFVALGPDVVGRVQIGNLSDLFIKDFRGSFAPGTRVQGRVVTVDRKAGRVELTLKPSVVDPENHKAQVMLADLGLGDKVKGTVKRVESYGLFVTIDNSSLVGLCHISEVAAEFVSNLSEIFTQGDRVKAMITKIDATTNKISLSLKAEHFVGDVDSDDEDAAGAEEEADDVAAAEDESDDDDGDEGEVDEEGDSDGASDDAMSEDPVDSDDDLGVVIKASKSRASAGDADESGARKRKFKEVPTLHVGGGFFDEDDDEDDEAGGIFGKGSDDDESDNDAEEETSKKKSKRAKRMAKRAEEEEITAKEQDMLDNADTPESAAAFDRLLLGEPNNSYLWVK
jgi:rRNA biogenesis protein RRP5